MSSIPHSILCVDDPEIREVFILETGEHLSAQEAIGSDYDKLEKLRMELAESVASDNPKYLCPICHIGIYLVCSPHNDKKRFYFRHRYENGNCPAITRSDMSKEEIEARKYNGVKESPAHFRLKHIVAESLARDPDFSNIQIEKVWKGQDRTTWRKPDVQAIWKGTLPVAFEVQLSTTFLHVIAERRLFYKAEGGLICWIFKSFDKISAKMTQDDVFFNNNHNLFLVSEETLKTSKEQQSLILDCHWSEPIEVNGEISKLWNSRFTKFSELSQDLEKQRIYLFDYDKQKQLLIGETNSDSLKQRFEKWWCSYSDADPYDSVWHSFKSEFRNENIYIPEYPNQINHLLNALYSAKMGKAVGWKYPKLISVAHCVADKYKSILQIFRVALYVYKRAGQIMAEDRTGKWLKKSQEFRKEIHTEDSYKMDTKFDDIILFLFPELMKLEIFEKIKKLDKPYSQ
jgi:hypothetical protein